MPSLVILLLASQLQASPREELRGKDIAVLATQFPKRSRRSVTALFDEYLLTSVQESGLFSATTGKDDIAAILELDKQKQLLGCDDVGCMTEIGGALGVRLLLQTKVVSAEDEWAVTMKIIDIQEGRAISRSVEFVQGGTKSLLKAVPNLVEKLLSGGGSASAHPIAREVEVRGEAQERSARRSSGGAMGPGAMPSASPGLSIASTSAMPRQNVTVRKEFSRLVGLVEERGTGAERGAQIEGALIDLINAYRAKPEYRTIGVRGRLRQACGNGDKQRCADLIVLYAGGIDGSANAASAHFRAYRGCEQRPRNPETCALAIALSARALDADSRAQTLVLHGTLCDIHEYDPSCGVLLTHDGLDEVGFDNRLIGWSLLGLGGFVAATTLIVMASDGTDGMGLALCFGGSIVAAGGGAFLWWGYAARAEARERGERHLGQLAATLPPRTGLTLAWQF